MSLETARAVYPILVRVARDLSLAVQERRTPAWVSYDDLCNLVKEVGIKETPRTVLNKVLKPVQAVCLENGLPDLSAVVIQKPKARTDSGNLVKPADGWWEVYVVKEQTTTGDIPFWWKQFQTARDYAEWPEAAPF